jgi:hypothetical protein
MLWLSLAADYISGGRFDCATAQMASSDLMGAWGFNQYELSWLPPAAPIRVPASRARAGGPLCWPAMTRPSCTEQHGAADEKGFDW